MRTETPHNTHDPRSAAAEREAELRRWERLRAHGRTHFLWRNGVLGWGLPAALLTAVYKIIQEQGLVLSPAMTPTLRNALVLIAIVFPVLGWLFGGWLWERGEERYRAMRGEGDR